MTIEDAAVIDGAGLDKSTGDVVLTISDHLSWDDQPVHFRLLEAKIGRYLDFVRSGQVWAVPPCSRQTGSHPFDLPTRTQRVGREIPGRRTAPTRDGRRSVTPRAIALRLLNITSKSPGSWGRVGTRRVPRFGKGKTECAIWRN